MNQNQIKWLAAALMLIDHIGLMLEAEPMRIIGRLSFPLFSWVFAQNWKRPGDKNPLITRLILFGVLSQIPHMLLFRNLQLNIMFSFAVAALTLSYIRRFDRKIAVLSTGLVTAQILGVSYGWYAVACPLLMIRWKGGGSRLWWFGWTIVNIGYTISCKSSIQIFAIFTPLVLAYYDSSKDQKPTTLEKRFFYYFYPLHLGGLAALRTIF
jgi:hypothetical protein